MSCVVGADRASGASLVAGTGFVVDFVVGATASEDKGPWEYDEVSAAAASFALREGAADRLSGGSSSSEAEEDDEEEEEEEEELSASPGLDDFNGSLRTSGAEGGGAGKDEGKCSSSTGWRSVSSSIGLCIVWVCGAGDDVAGELSSAGADASRNLDGPAVGAGDSPTSAQA
jgi:hypothetical protein